MLTHPASAGHGLNLQAGGSIISLELYMQANARLHRQGQKENLIVHYIIVKGTVDEDVMRALDKKEVNEEELLLAVKASIYKEQK